ncbi:ATP-binding protein [Streptomyces sp. NPDC127108]|uniref:ATP-binding protein n=1 Tax=Streptomyces sp. NPDC127108 TaxID=3345361 RepID=UPI0036382236
MCLLIAAAAAGAAVAALAPDEARAWVGAAAAGGWILLTVAVLVGLATTNRLRARVADAEGELLSVRGQLDTRTAEDMGLAQVTLPGVARLVREGVAPDEVLRQTRPPALPSQRELLRVSVGALADAEQRAATAAAAQRRTADDLARVTEDVRLLATETLPDVVATLRAGASVDRALAGTRWPDDAALRALTDAAVRELALSERRAAAAQAASAKALSRVQAKSVSMLADLRDMQDRHGEEVFGDLLRLDHSTSQLGLMTDRLALLMGGRSSRAWNKPIVMESILRGAVGRIAAYQRVRLHCSTRVAVVGFAAEGVMHLLAELADNAANFSPPTDEVHVYVEESRTGIVITIEDSGLRMSEAAQRRAEESVSGRMTDLALLQGTRLGLAVVGGLAVKYGINVSFRPSARGGTGVVVLLPPQLIAQQPQPERAPALDAPALPASGTAAALGAEAVPTPRTAAEAPATPAAPVDAGLGGAPGERAGTPEHTAVRERAADGTDEYGRAPGHGTDGRGIATDGRGGTDGRGIATGGTDGRGIAAGGTDGRGATLGGLPMRRPGRTMAAAHAELQQRQAANSAAREATRSGPDTTPGGRGTTPAAPDAHRHPDPGAPGTDGADPAGAERPPRDLGARFGAFHRARRAAAEGEPPRAAHESEPPRAE